MVVRLSLSPRLPLVLSSPSFCSHPASASHAKMDGGPCIRMENADDPRFALNADDPRSAHPRESEPVNYLWDLRKYLLLLENLVAFVTYQAAFNPPGGFWSGTESDHRVSVTYQAGMNPPGGFWSGTESEHSSALHLVEITLEIYLAGYVSPFVEFLKAKESSLGLVLFGAYLGGYSTLEEFLKEMMSSLGLVLVLGIALVAYLGGYSTLGEFLKEMMSSLGLVLVLGIALGAYLGGYSALGDFLKQMMSFLGLVLVLVIAMGAFSVGYSTLGEFCKEKMRWRIAGKDDNDCLVLLNGESSNRSQSQAGIWYMDSGAQCHATGDLRLFSGHLNMTKQGSWIYGVRGTSTRCQYVASGRCQAGMNPTGGFCSGTESEHSRIKGSNELKDVVRRSQTLLSCTLEIALFITVLILCKAIEILRKAKAAGASRDYESTSMASDRESEPENYLSGRRKYLMLLAILLASSTYQAGMNPTGGFWSGTESEHSRIKGSNELTDVVRSQTLLSCTLAIALFITVLILCKAIEILRKAKAAGASRDSESTSMASDRESEPENYLSGRRKYLMLLAILLASSTYQAGMNPTGGFWSGTESEHSRIKGSNELTDVVRSQTLLSCTLAIALLFTLLIRFKTIGIPPNVKETGASRDYESTSMGSYREYEPENSSGFDSMVAKDNAVAETIATWHVGSASTHHATGNRALLSDVKTVDNLNIQTGDGIIMPVSGRGSVITDMVVLHDVWFVPGLKKNVVSVSQLAELDCSIVFKRDACYISGATDGTIIGKALVGENGMFKLEFLKVPLVN